MYKFLIILALCALCHSAPSAKQNVLAPISSCGGMANVVDMRILGCDNCDLIPGQRYDIQIDFYPSEAAPSLRLRAEVCMEVGFCTIILDVELLSSQLFPAVMYTTKYNLVPGDRAKEHRTVYYNRRADGTDVIQVCAAMAVSNLEQ